MTFLTLNPFKYPNYATEHYIIQKTLKYIKITLHRSHKDKQYTNVSKNKRNITKMYFHMPLPHFWCQFMLLTSKYTDFIFGPNLVPPKVSRQ